MPGLDHPGKGVCKAHPKGSGLRPSRFATFALFKSQKHDTFVVTDNNLIHCICFCKQPMPSHIHSIVYIRIFSLGKYLPPQNYHRTMTGAMCTCLYDNG